MNEAQIKAPLLGADKVRAVYANSLTCTKPWLVYVDARLLVAKNGVGRRFATESAARSAGLKSLFSSPTNLNQEPRS